MREETLVLLSFGLLETLGSKNLRDYQTGKYLGLRKNSRN